MLVDGFNDLHGFRASVPDDGEFDGVMGFAVPVLHVSVKERGAALLTLLSQFRRSIVRLPGPSGRRSMRAICRTVLRGLCVVAVLPSVLLAVGLCAFWRWLWDDDDERSRYGYGY